MARREGRARGRTRLYVQFTGVKFPGRARLSVLAAVHETQMRKRWCRREKKKKRWKRTKMDQDLTRLALSEGTQQTPKKEINVFMCRYFFYYLE